VRDWKKFEVGDKIDIQVVRIFILEFILGKRMENGSNCEGDQRQNKGPFIE
jgi:hypothetical protein